MAFLSFSSDGLEQFILCGILQITSKILQSHSLIRITWLIQCITLKLQSSSASSSSSDLSRSNFSCVTLFSRNFHFSTADSTAWSKSMLSFSIKHSRVFMTLRCIGILAISLIDSAHLKHAVLGEGKLKKNDHGSLFNRYFWPCGGKQ